MKASSLGLTVFGLAAILVAGLNTADAAFVGAPFRSGVALRAPLMRAPINAFATPRFQPWAPRFFGPDRRRIGRFFPFLGGYSYPNPYYPSSAPYGDVASNYNGGAPGYVVNAPSFNITVTTATPSYAQRAAPAVLTSGGPKIILIGSSTHSTHGQKMPVVIYGTARAY
jgi:hypothetical protein